MNQLTKTWLIWSSAAALSTLLLGLTLVWLNIERVDLAYGLKSLQTKVDQLEAHASKLQVERDNLASPYNMRKMAVKYGLKPAQSGQIRRIANNDEF